MAPSELRPKRVSSSWTVGWVRSCQSQLGLMEESRTNWLMPSVVVLGTKFKVYPLVFDVHCGRQRRVRLRHRKRDAAILPMS